MKRALYAIGFALAVQVAGCVAAAPVRRVHIESPVRRGAVRVVVENQPVAAPAPRPPGDGVYVNDCESVARLGGEARMTWIARVERYIEGRAHHLASVTYPPGDGVDIALVSFSSPR